MKKLIIPTLILLIAWSCSISQKAASSAKNSAIVIDTTQYDITIIDPGFDQWYFFRYSQAKDLSNEIYKSKNLFAVSNWNNYYLRGRYASVINNHLFYDNTTDYGIEVNRKLYWYFVYIEETYRIPLFY